MQENKNNKITARPPVVVVMGHIDHGKSTLLDYVRKTTIAEEEAGGITQNISAYEVLHKDENGENKKITFLDTPGHEAFSKMRERGAEIADIAILVVAADDGVKPQTIEAWKTIHESNLPCIVAINKIDKPDANLEKTKTQLAENEIYLENYGGKIPFVEISAKTGTGIDNLLSLILLLSEMENLNGNENENASGFVIEVNLDPKRGILATLIIKNGSLKKGMTVVAEDAICSTRVIENYLGKAISEATFSSPVQILGFDKMPRVGAEFKSFGNKQDALEYAENFKSKTPNLGVQLPSGSSASKPENSPVQVDKKIIPIVLKADVGGSIEAIEKEIKKIKGEGAEFKVIGKGVGPITMSDIKSLASSENAIIIGFNVKAEKSAIETAQKRGILISNFNIIYKMTEWLTEEMEKLRPRIETTEMTGRAKILRAFSRTKERQIIGGKVLEGQLVLGAIVKILRRDFEIGRGKIVNLEKGKVKTGAVEEGAEFGMMIESKMEIVEGDVIESFSITQK